MEYKDSEILRKLYSQDNMSLSKISRVFNISRPCITYWIKKHDIKLRPKVKLNLSKEELEDLYINKKLSTLKIAKIARVNSRSTIRRKLIQLKIPLRQQIEVATKYKKVPFSGNMQEKAYLIGLRLGDLHAYRLNRQIRISTTTTHPAQIHMIKDVFGKYSHVHHYCSNGRYGYKQITIYSHLDKSFEFLLEKPNSIPKWIINDNQLFLPFLAGFMDSEGCWCIRRDKKNNLILLFQLSNTNKEWLIQISRKLKQLSIESAIEFDKRIYNVNHFGFKQVYDLQVRRKDKVITMAEKLLPLSKHEEKIKKMELVIKVKNTKAWSELERLTANLKQTIKEGVYLVKSGNYKECECTSSALRGIAQKPFLP